MTFRSNGGAQTRVQYCETLKSETLRRTLSGEWPRWILNRETAPYDRTTGGEPSQGISFRDMNIRVDIRGGSSCKSENICVHNFCSR